MWARTVRRFVVATAAFGASAACGHDGSTAPPSATTPSAIAAPARAGSALVTPIAVLALQRSAPLAASESATAIIGTAGGRLSLPTAGLTVVVPPLAVVFPTTITVTALAGSDVAYEFSPHGLVFLAPVAAIQDLRVTQAADGGLVDPLSLFVGYFTNSNSVTVVTELLGVSLNLAGQWSTVALSHFSGYVWSSGRGDGQEIDAPFDRRGAREYLAPPAVPSHRQAFGKL